MPRIFLICCCSVFLLAALDSWAVDARELLITAERAESQHQFETAQGLLQSLLEVAPTNASAWLKLASIATVRGDIAGARKACSQVALRVDPIVTLACRGRIALATLQHEQGFHALTSLLEHPHYRDREDLQTRWARGIAAELAVALGRDADADRYFYAALQGKPGLQLQCAWLDHLLTTGRYSRVLETVNAGEPNTALNLRRLIALQRLGRADEAKQQLDYFDWLFRDALQRREHLHAREIARFYLDVLPRPGLALAAATHNLDYQREAEDYLLYHRAVGKAGAE